MPSEREDHCMVSLPDGKVMILGGNNGIHPDPFTIQHKRVLRFDPATNTFDDMPSLKKTDHGQVAQSSTVNFTMEDQWYW